MERDHSGTLQDRVGPESFGRGWSDAAPTFVNTERHVDGM
jgi:hypothetical protein